MASFFGRVNWNYNEKYMATAIIRADRYTFYARQEHLSRGHEIPEKVIADE